MSTVATLEASRLVEALALIRAEAVRRCPTCAAGSVTSTDWHVGPASAEECAAAQLTDFLRRCAAVETMAEPAPSGVNLLMGRFRAKKAHEVTPFQVDPGTFYSAIRGGRMTLVAGSILVCVGYAALPSYWCFRMVVPGDDVLLDTRDNSAHGVSEHIYVYPLDYAREALALEAPAAYKWKSV